MPERGRHLRVLICEMNRIASHLVGMGAYGLDLGTFSPFLYAFREREKILDLFEEACGARLTYSYLTPGGATADLPRGWTDKCSAFLDQFWPLIQEYHTLLTTNAIFVKRTAGIGLLSPEMAISFGTSGPVLRGSGIDHDLRRDGEEIYTSMYDGYAFEVICERNGHYPNDHDYPAVPHEAVLGDCWHRFYVRMLEVVQSVDLCRQAIDRYNRRPTASANRSSSRRSCPRAKCIWKPNARRGRWAFTWSAQASRFRGGRGRGAVASATCRSPTRCAAAA